MRDVACRRHRLCSVVIVVLAALVAGATSSRALAAEDATTSSVDAITNDMCPVMTDELTDPDIWVEYKGRRVYFCCQKCKRQFKADPEKYVVNLASFAAPAQGGSATTSAVEVEPEGAPDAGANEVAPARDADADAPAPKGRGRTRGLPKLLVWFGKFHPASVNFPVGLLVAAAMAEALLIFTKRPSYAASARFCVWIGALGAVGAGTLGWFYGGVHIFEDRWLLATHRWLGTATALAGLVTLVLSEAHARGPDAPARTRRYRAALFCSAFLVTATGFFGGAMAFGIDHYAW